MPNPEFCQQLIKKRNCISKIEDWQTSLHCLHLNGLSSSSLDSVMLEISLPEVYYINDHLMTDMNVISKCLSAT